MSHKRKRQEEPWITRTKRELEQENEHEEVRRIRKEKCLRCRRYDAPSDSCPLDDLSPCKPIPKMMTRAEAAKLLRDYVKWALEDGDLNSPFFDFDPGDVFLAMSMGADALEQGKNECV